MTNQRGSSARVPDRNLSSSDAIVTRRRPRGIWGLIIGSLLVLGATAAVAAPVMSPGVVAPVARLVNVESTKAARGAYVDAQRQNGWEILPAVQLDLTP